PRFRWFSVAEAVLRGPGLDCRHEWCKRCRPACANVAVMDADTWFDRSYARRGFAAQRLYPNEELLRFFGRHYFGLTAAERLCLNVLEVGCGSGANLWMIAREGFAAHGIDFAPEAVALARSMLAHWQVEAVIEVADMTAARYPDAHFDVIC